MKENCLLSLEQQLEPCNPFSKPPKHPRQQNTQVYSLVDGCRDFKPNACLHYYNSDCNIKSDTTYQFGAFVASSRNFPNCCSNFPNCHSCSSYNSNTNQTYKNMFFPCFLNYDHPHCHNTYHFTFEGFSKNHQTHNTTICSAITGMDVQNHMKFNKITKKHTHLPLPPNFSISKRTIFNQDQLESLEKRFLKQTFLSKDERILLGSELNLTERQVMIWFQNRRYNQKHF